jgi:polyphosphate glucokinase
MKVLVIDVGGTHVKILATGQKAAREFESAPQMTPEQMVAGVKTLAGAWRYDAVSVGYPGAVLRNRPVGEPYNLGRGWVDFDFGAAFGCPAKIINDAAMQALGSYHEGNMLFLGLGTGLGTAMVFNGIVEPMELAHLPYRKATFEDYVGRRGLERLGRKKWRRHVHEVIELLRAALLPDDIVIGGGNAARLPDLPAGCRRGDNANAFVGGFRLWKAKRKGKGMPAGERARAATQAERAKKERK